MNKWKVRLRSRRRTLIPWTDPNWTCVLLFVTATAQIIPISSTFHAAFSRLVVNSLNVRLCITTLIYGWSLLDLSALTHQHKSQSNLRRLQHYEFWDISFWDNEPQPTIRLHRIGVTTNATPPCWVSFLSLTPACHSLTVTVAVE